MRPPTRSGSPRAGFQALARAALDAALVGAAVGLADLTLVAARASLAAAELASALLVVVGLDIALVLATGTPFLLLVRLVARHPRLRAFATSVRVPGPERVAALGRLAVWLSALAAVWTTAYAVIRFASAAYRHAGAAALLSSTVIVAALVAALLLASWLAPTAGAVLARSRALDRLTRGRTAVAAALLATVAVGLSGRGVLRSVAPLWDPAAAAIHALAGALLAVAAVSRVARRLARRQLAIVAGLCALACGAGLLLVDAAESARQAIVGQGAPSRTALRLLQRLSDRDGDGFSTRFGGGDCDDRDDRVHPRAAEVADNGRDDNCAAGDVAASARAHRLVERASSDPRAPRHDILLVTMDAVRADHTSVYGYARRTTPVLERLAARGTRFARAESSSSVTRWALPALLFGRHPTAMAVRLERGIRRPDPRGLPTLASTLAEAGYETRAILGLRGMVTDGNLLGFAEVENLATPVAHRPHPDNAADVTRRAVTWLHGRRRSAAPAFLWLHYIDPHGTYERPAGAPDFGDSDVDRYDSEIAHVDEQVGRLLDPLERPDGRPTIVVVAADHGEAFGDHGTFTHGKSLHEEQTHVPLVVALPGGVGRVASGPVGLVDLAPTLLDLVGVTTPSGMSGVSLARVIRDGAPVPDHPVVSQLIRDARVPRDLVALHKPGWKLIRDLEVDTTELYDLERDPGERVDRGDHALAAELAAELARLSDVELAPLQDDARATR